MGCLRESASLGAATRTPSLRERCRGSPRSAGPHTISEVCPSSGRGRGRSLRARGRWPLAQASCLRGDFSRDGCATCYLACRNVSGGSPGQCSVQRILDGLLPCHGAAFGPCLIEGNLANGRDRLRRRGSAGASRRAAGAQPRPARVGGQRSWSGERVGWSAPQQAAPAWSACRHGCSSRGLSSRVKARPPPPA